MDLETRGQLVSKFEVGWPRLAASYICHISFALCWNRIKHVQNLEEIKADSALTLDSEEGSAQLPEEEVKPKDVSTEKTDTEEPQQT